LQIPAGGETRSPRDLHRAGFAGLGFPRFDRFDRMAAGSAYDLGRPGFDQFDRNAAVSDFDRFDRTAAMLDYSIR
jgi:hypothetical protein